MTTLKHNSGCGDTTSLLDQTLVSLLNSPWPNGALPYNINF